MHGRLRTKITTGNGIRHRQFFRGHGNAVLLVSIFSDLAPCAMVSQSGMSTTETKVDGKYAACH